MKVEYDNRTYDVYLLDDGSLDTVISIDGVEVRFDQEYAAIFRDPDGSLPNNGLWNLAHDAIEDGLHLPDWSEVNNDKVTA